MPPIVPILLFFVLVLVILLFREASRVRRSGLSQASPGCGRCLYPLGNWSSSVCPECGTDARTNKVRTGPRSDRIAFTMLVGIVLAAGLMIAASETAGRAFYRVPWHSEAVFTSTDDSGIAIHLDSRRVWRSLRSYASGSDAITIAAAPEVPAAELWPWTTGSLKTTNGTTITLTGWLPETPDDSIEAAVRQAAPDEWSDDDVAERVEQVQTAISKWLQVMSPEPGGLEASQELVSDITWLGFETRIQTSTGISGVDWPAQVIEALMIPVGFLLAWWLARRFCHGAWREAEDGEWGIDC